MARHRQTFPSVRLNPSSSGQLRTWTSRPSSVSGAGGRPFSMAAADLRQSSWRFRPCSFSPFAEHLERLQAARFFGISPCSATTAPRLALRRHVRAISCHSAPALLRAGPTSQELGALDRRYSRISTPVLGDPDILLAGSISRPPPDQGPDLPVNEPRPREAIVATGITRHVPTDEKGVGAHPLPSGLCLQTKLGSTSAP